MNVLDWCLIIIAVSGLLLGYQRGLVGQLVSLAGLILAYVIAYQYYKVVAIWLEGWIQWPALEMDSLYGLALQELDWEVYLNNAIAFISIFIIVKMLCSLLGAIIQMIVKVPGLNILNKWSGAMLGLLGAMIIVVVAVNVLTAIPAEAIQKQLHESRATQFMKQYLPEFINPLDIWQNRIEKEPFDEPQRVPQIGRAHV